MFKAVLHTGAAFDPPVVDKWRPPPGEVSWVDEDITSVSTSGPALTVSVDFTNPRARNREQVVVVRLRDVKGYFPTSYPDYTDPQENLAVSATVHVPASGTVSNLVMVIPYITMPRDSGGITEVEIAVHEPAGALAALEFHQIDLPEDFDRTPDMLSVIAHILVALARVHGPLTRKEVRIIRTLLVSNFDLDDLGDQSLRRILKVAAGAQHSPKTLSEVILHSVPEVNRGRLVNLVYACFEGSLSERQQHFVEEMLDLAGIYDTWRFGPEHLREHFEELEVEPGAGIEAVKSAYKQLVRDYHPDRVEHLAKGFQKFALEKTTRLNLAYQELNKALAQGNAEVAVEIEE